MILLCFALLYGRGRILLAAGGLRWVGWGLLVLLVVSIDIRNYIIFAVMVKVMGFKRKQPECSNDYEQAYKIIDVISKGETIAVNPDNIKAFRKYICDLAMKNNIQLATRLQHDKSLNVTRLV